MRGPHTRTFVLLVRCSWTGCFRDVRTRLAVSLALSGALLTLAIWLARRVDAPEPAKIVVWTASRRGGPIQVSVNGIRVGELAEYYSAGRPPCSSTRGVVFLVLPPGSHRVAASDLSGRRWFTNVALVAEECVRLRLVEGDERPMVP